jgi:two-component system CheB/CheR fusion protein
MGKIDFPVIGIGASAGGLKVLQQFFDNLDEGSGMTFVVITHLAPEKTSAMDELLASHTKMDVEQVRDKTRIEPNHIYIIPPKKQLILKGNELLLEEKEKGQQSVIDVFFRSMAKECEKLAVGVILSGTGSDGTLGLKAVKEYGGVTMVQDPEEADYSDMPRNAIGTDLVDFILPVDELARKVIDHKEVLSEVTSLSKEDLTEEENSALQEIFKLLASQKGHDFKHYKRSSVLRRLQRRLFVTRNRSISEYQRYLEEHPVEITELFNDLLISVTNFFRDPEAFEVIEKNIIPKLFEDKNPEEPIRIWVTACATGEEVYSLAILLQEYASKLDYRPQIKIFGTDISDEALRVARRGVYSEAIATDISKERLQGYFHKVDSGYRVNKEIREKVLISNHDILSDPPFLKQDLVACRNLLIYLNNNLQNEVLKILHYSLHPGGFLFLGKADSILGAKDFFVPIDKTQGIYRSRQVPTSQRDIPRFPLLSNFRRSRSVGVENNADKNLTFGKVHYSLLADQYAPPSLIIDENNQVMHSSKGVDRYLSYAEGEPTRNVLKMISPQIQRSLRSIIFRYNQLEKPQLISKKIEVKQDDDKSQTLNLSIRPIEVSGFPQGFRQLTFEKIDEPGVQTVQKKLDDNREAVESEIVEHLEEELEQTKGQLQQTIEEYETSNEELMASNEELQSMNEELQTTTEELETSKEELQSVNEELRTVNQELEIKIDELKQANDDLKNLMEATEIAILFLDNKLNTRLYTSNVTELFHLIDSDVGRPLSDVTHELKYDSLVSDLNEMLAESKSIQKQVSTQNGDWFIMQLKPYKTTEYEVEGVVLTFVNITEFKKMETELRAAHKKLEDKIEAEKQLQSEILNVEKKERWRLG